MWLIPSTGHPDEPVQIAIGIGGRRIAVTLAVRQLNAAVGEVQSYFMTFSFISLRAQRNEPKKGHPGQGLQSKHSISKKSHPSDCARGGKRFAFIYFFYLLSTSPSQIIYLFSTVLSCTFFACQETSGLWARIRRSAPAGRYHSLVCRMRLSSRVKSRDLITLAAG